MSICSEFFVKDKETSDQVKELNNSITPLPAMQTSFLKDEVKILKSAQTTLNLSETTLKKQVSELMKNIEELHLAIWRAEQAAIDGVFDAETNIKEQIKLKAPDLDVSEVDAFKKVMDENVVSIL
ncbi:hypothetical protein HN51_057709 [Arachis hypogaea]